MRSKPFVVLMSLAILTSSGCAILKHDTKSPAKLFPAARYLETTDSDTRYAEYLVEGIIRENEGLGNLPMASGPLRVDCTTLIELGVMVRHANWKPSSLPHSYDYTIVNRDNPDLPLHHLSFEKLMWRGYVRGRIRFRSPPPDGIYTMSVEHQGHVLLTTEFDLYNCE